jgi:choice-of-anchor A domain-containing protein
VKALQRLFALFTILIFSAQAFAGPSHSWLLSQQNADGSFSNSTDIAINHQATGETITALLMDKVVSPSSLTLARDFLYTSDSNSTEMLARKIIASAAVNGTADSSLVNTLTSFKNSNGGFGTYKTYESDPLSTAWALRAFGIAKINSATSAAAVGYLITAVNSDGGWRLDGVSSVALTAEVMLALNGYKNNTGVATVLANARSYIWSLKQADNLWGDSFESALALSALSLSVPVQADLLPSIESLDARKLANSSWDSDVYTTALVLQAFKRFNSLSGSSSNKGGITGQLLVAGTSIPVANAQIYVDGTLSTVKTDTNGRFSLASLNEGLATLLFQKSGFQAVSKAVQIDASVNSDSGIIYIAQTAGTSLVGGRIYDSATGLGISGAVVILTGASNQSITANSQGAIEASTLPAGSYSFEITAPGYYSASGTFALGMGTPIVLNQSLVASSTPLVSDPVDVTAVVVDGTTQATVPFAVATLDNIPVVADANGQFTVPSVVRGAHQILVSASGFLDGAFTFTLAPGASGNLGKLAIYKPGAVGGNQDISLLAKCVDGISGAPIFGATFKVKESLIVGVTDSQGLLSLNHIPTLSFVIEIVAPGYLDQVYTVEASGFGSIAGTFVLTPTPASTGGFSVSGIVRDSETNEPIEGVVLSIPETVQVTSGADGSYKIEGAQDIPFILRAIKDGYLPYQLTINVTEEAAAYIFNPVLTKDKSINLVSVESVDMPTPVEPDSQPVIKAKIKNLSAEPLDVVIVARVQDVNGVDIATLLPFDIASHTPKADAHFEPNETLVFDIPWSVLQTAAGSYSVVVDVIEPNTQTRDLPRGRIFASKSIDTQVSGVSKFGGSLNMSPPILQAGAKTPVQMQAVLRNTGNQLLPSGSYKLIIYKDDQTAPVFEATTENDALEINQIAQLDFGSWSPAESLAGQYHALIQRTDSISGSVVADVYIGDVANATFTLDKSILPVGSSAIKGNVHLTGVDNTIAKSTDPLLDVVKTAVEKGATYTGPAAVAWQKSNKCLGCHIQAQTLAGLSASLGKASIDKAPAFYLLNETLTAPRSDGAINSHDSNFGPVTSTLFSAWALTEWPEQKDSINALVAASNYIWANRKTSGTQVYWDSDSDTGWLFNTHTATAVAAMSLARTKDALDEIGEIPTNFALNTLYPLNASKTGQSIIKAKGGYVYVAKPGGYMERIDLNTKVSTTLFTSVAGVSGRVDGLDIDQNGNFVMATEQAKVLRVSPAGAIINSYAACTKQAGGIAISPAGDIYVSCHDDNYIKKINTAGQISMLASGGVLNRPYGITWHQDGYLIGANYSGINIIKVLPNGTASLYADGLSSRPLDVAVLPDGSVLATGSQVRGESTGIDLISANGVARRVVLHGSPWSIDIDETGTAYVGNVAGTQVHSLKTQAANVATFNANIANIAGVANFVNTNFNIADTDNLNQAARLITVGELRKLLPTDTVLADKMKQLDVLLRARQSANGGWGRTGKAANNVTDPLVTALVGLALEYTSPSAQDPVVRNTIIYLLNTQQATGIWHSTGNIFSTNLGSTSLVMVYLPKAIERLGGIDVKVALDMPGNVTLSNPNFTPLSVIDQADGTKRHTWEIKGVTGTGRDLKFDLAIQDLDLGEVRPVAKVATLAFGNSFTDEIITRPFDIPTVTALNKLSLAPATDKAAYSANESVAVSAMIKNLGENFSGGHVDLNIRASGYTSPLASLGSFNVGSVLSQQSTTLNTSWNTALTLTGNYEVFGQLFDTKGRLVAEGVAGFVIAPSSGNNPALAAQVFNDKLSYTTSETAIIEARAINTTTNVDHEATLGKLSVKRSANGQEVFARSYAIPELAIGAFSSYPTNLPLAEMGAGEYLVDWKVYTANGQTLISQASSQFTVEADLRASITGAVVAKYPTVEVGEAQQCDFTTTNIGAAPLDNIALNQLVVAIDSEQVMETSSRTVTIAAQANDKKLQTISTAGYTKGNYACVLQAVLNDRVYNLAQAVFAVKEPDIKLDAIINAPSKGRLLVLIDPPKGNNKDVNPLDTYLRNLLDSAGWYYTIVNNAKDFADELQQGGYSEYALLSQQVTLTPQTRDLLKAKVAAGEGLVVGDGHDRRHQSLEPALGVRVHSKQTHIAGVKLNQSVLGTPWSHNFSEGLNSLTFDLSGATLDGEYIIDPSSKNAPHPFGAAADYNAFVFDNFASLSSAVEGRLAVGGTLNINNFGIGNKLDSKKLTDVVVVGGDAIFPSGRVYYGNLLAGGNVSGVGAAVVNGMDKNAVVIGNVNPLPVDFEGEREYLKELSANIATLPATGTYTYQYGIYTAKGDCTSKVQVFNVLSSELGSANTLKISCIPTGATIIFNIQGDIAKLSNIGMQDLTSFREKVLFNVPTATQFVMSSVGIQGSVLAPYAEFYNPAGSIDGRLMAKSWLSNNYGWVGINNGLFTGDLSAAVAKGKKNAVAHYQYQNGKSAFIAFDVANQAMLMNQPGQGVNHFAKLLLAALDYANPQALNTNVGRSMLYTLDVKNLVATPVATKVLLNITPSDGATYTALLLEGFSPTANAHEWSAPMSLGANETLTRKLYIKLPSVAGQSLNIRVRLQTGEGATAVIRADKSLPVTVLP